MKVINYWCLSVLITAEIQVGKQTFENISTQIFQTDKNFYKRSYKRYKPFVKTKVFIKISFSVSNVSRNDSVS